MEKEVKSILSSLIISFRNEISIKKLRYDFREVTGYDVPFRKFGYSTFKDYLNSIPNTCRINGHGDYAIVLPVINEQNKHINDMVLKGCVPKTNSRRRPRIPRGFNDSNINNFRKPPPLLSIPMHNFRPPTTNSNSNVKVRALPDEYYVGQPDDYYDAHPASKSCQKPASKSCEKTDSDLHAKSNRDCFEEEASSINHEARIDGNASPAYDSDSDYNLIDFDYQSDDEKQEDLGTRIANFWEETDEEDFLKVPFPMSDEEPQPEPKVHPNVQQKLHTLISEHDDGIWCSMLLTVYFKRFNEKLNPRDYGFCNVLELCDDLPDVLKSVRHNRRDWKLYNLRKAHTRNVQFRKYIAKNLKPPDTNKELVPTSWYSNEIVQPDQIINRETLPNDKGINDYIEIFISEIYDPSKFWIQLRSPKTTQALETLMDEMQKFYMIFAGRYQINEFSVRIGLLCVALFMNEYHRAVVIKVFDEHIMQVFYIDYGSVAEVPIRKTCFLHRRFSYLPQQAIRAQLYNIIPVAQKTMWPREASCHMLNLVMEKSLIALIVNIDNSKKILELIVSDTNSPDIDIHINDELITAGYAEIGNDAKIVEKLTALPHDYFYTIESKKTPETNKSESVYIRMFKKCQLK